MSKLNLNQSILAQGSLVATVSLIAHTLTVRPRKLIATVLAVTVVVILAASIFSPSYDHSFYLEQAKQAAQSGELLTNHGENLTPYINTLAIANKILGVDIGYHIVNIIVLSSIVLLMSQNGANTRYSKWFRPIGYSIIGLVILPTFLTIVASANKDLLIAFAALSCLSGLMYLGNRLAYSRAISGRQLLKNMALILSGALILRMQRPYFFSFMLSFTALAFSLVLLCRWKLSNGIVFIIAVAGSIFAGAATLYSLGLSIKSIESAYLGRATIYSLFGVKVTSVVDALRFAITAVYEGYFALLFPRLQETSIGLLNHIAGFFDQLVFLASLVFLLLSKRLSTFAKAFILSILIYHCEVQVFGAPNYGAFLRLRFGMYVFVLASLLNKRSQNLVNRYRNGVADHASLCRL